MREPKQGKDGLWAAGGMTFASKEAANEFLKMQKSGSGLALRSIAPFFVPVAVVALIFWWLNRPVETSRVGREFATMQQCLDFIESDLGEPLMPIHDKPGDISGKSAVKGLFFRCEAQMTGTHGPVLQGRWDRSK